MCNGVTVGPSRLSPEGHQTHSRCNQPLRNKADLTDAERFLQIRPGYGAYSRFRGLLSILGG